MNALTLSGLYQLTDMRRRLFLGMAFAEMDSGMGAKPFQLTPSMILLAAGALDGTGAPSVPQCRPAGRPYAGSRVRAAWPSPVTVHTW